jgi:hypothetical protein
MSFSRAEEGFLGVCINTLIQIPFFCGHLFNALTLLLFFFFRIKKRAELRIYSKINKNILTFYKFSKLFKFIMIRIVIKKKKKYGFNLKIKLLPTIRLELIITKGRILSPLCITNYNK